MEDRCGSSTVSSFHAWASELFACLPNTWLHSRAMHPIHLLLSCPLLDSCVFWCNAVSPRYPQTCCLEKGEKYQDKSDAVFNSYQFLSFDMPGTIIHVLIQPMLCQSMCGSGGGVSGQWWSVKQGQVDRGQWSMEDLSRVWTPGPLDRLD